jgi:hypothetical protein
VLCIGLLVGVYVRRLCYLLGRFYWLFFFLMDGWMDAGDFYIGRMRGFIELHCVSVCLVLRDIERVARG